MRTTWGAPQISLPAAGGVLAQVSKAGEGERLTVSMRCLRISRSCLSSPAIIITRPTRSALLPDDTFVIRIAPQQYIHFERCHDILDQPDRNPPDASAP